MDTFGAIPEGPPSGTSETLSREETDFSNKEVTSQSGAVGSPGEALASTYNGGGGYKQNQVGCVVLGGQPIVSLHIDGKERLCLAQISSTLLKSYSYNEIHNRRVALGITCVQCTPVQLEILRRAGAMPISSRRCGMITKREAERLVKSFLEDTAPPKLPDNFAFQVQHTCGWGCKGSFIPSRYNSSRAKCIKCTYCNMFFSPNKFIFHYHRVPEAKYRHPDAANFNSWRRHLVLDYENSTEELVFAWEDVKAMFNGGSRRCERRCSDTALTATSPELKLKKARGDAAPQSAAAAKPYPYPLLPLPRSLPPPPYLRLPHPAFNAPPESPLSHFWRPRAAIDPPCQPFGFMWPQILDPRPPEQMMTSPPTSAPTAPKRRATEALWSPAGQLEKQQKTAHASAFKPVKVTAAEDDESNSEDDDDIDVESAEKEILAPKWVDGEFNAVSKSELQKTILKIMNNSTQGDASHLARDNNGNNCSAVYNI